MLNNVFKKMNKKIQVINSDEVFSLELPTRRIESNSIKEKLFKLSTIEGTHRLLINSSLPLTPWIVLLETQPLDYTVKIRVEGPRVLWDDVKGILTCHIVMLFCSCFTSSFVYLGFYLYEKWKPLYVVTMDVKKWQVNSDEKVIAEYQENKKRLASIPEEEIKVIQNPLFIGKH